MPDRVSSLQIAPEKLVCEAVRMNPKLQWRAQDVKDAINVEGLPSKWQATSGTCLRERPGHRKGSSQALGSS
jgi:hypothetical protein